MMQMLVVQVDAAALDVLERIATAQLVMAVVMVIIGLISVGAAVLAMVELRSVRRLIHAASDTLTQLRPRVTPLLDSALVLTTDLAALAEKVRLNVDDVTAALNEASSATRRAVTAAEERVQRLGAVLDVVQAETEELLLDAAATARGVHETARLLHDPRGGRQRVPRRGDPTRRPPPEPLVEEIIEEEVLNEEP